jgi:hypothetical protein
LCIDAVLFNFDNLDFLFRMQHVNNQPCLVSEQDKTINPITCWNRLQLLVLRQQTVLSRVQLQVTQDQAVTLRHYHLTVSNR